MLSEQLCQTLHLIIREINAKQTRSLFALTLSSLSLLGNRFIRNYTSFGHFLAQESVSNFALNVWEYRFYFMKMFLYILYSLITGFNMLFVFIKRIHFRRNFRNTWFCSFCWIHKWWLACSSTSFNISKNTIITITKISLYQFTKQSPQEVG